MKIKHKGGSNQLEGVRPAWLYLRDELPIPETEEGREQLREILNKIRPNKIESEDALANLFITGTNDLKPQ